MYLKYISIHIHNFEYSRVIMNMKLSMWSTNEYISDVQQKIIELPKLVKWL